MMEAIDIADWKVRVDTLASSYKEAMTKLSVIHQQLHWSAEKSYRTWSIKTRFEKCLSFVTVENETNLIKARECINGFLQTPNTPQSSVEHKTPSQVNPSLLPTPPKCLLLNFFRQLANNNENFSWRNTDACRLRFRLVCFVWLYRAKKLTSSD